MTPKKQKCCIKNHDLEVKVQANFIEKPETNRIKDSSYHDKKPILDNSFNHAINGPCTFASHFSAF